jgi:hypothetical protein
MKSFARFIGYFLILLVTFIVASFHAGVAIKPKDLVGKIPRESGLFIDKSRYGIHQLVVSGSAFERGYNAGRLTQNLLASEEQSLLDQLSRFIPNRLGLKIMTLAASNWFRGIVDYYEPWAINEMYGVSLWAPKQFDFLADGFTRQIAYHGLHEVGQMMVDKGVGFACTLVAVPFEKNWIVGRNFDFEGGDVFDREKVVKWVFPEEGHPYVSVIWAGMVGAVTGVNQNGLYISLNAAGSNDFRRIGTPSTLVITKALQFSNSVEEALDIFRNEKMFITDIFFLLDTKTARAYRVEKSPLRTAIVEIKTPSVIANDLQSPEFKNDSTNLFRRRELTSAYRQTRGEELLVKLKPGFSKGRAKAVDTVLSILRDKGELGGQKLHLNNRRAIDALIAAHSVIYDGGAHVLYVSQGPAVSGKFTGFDLEKSFAKHEPVVTTVLDADPEVPLAVWETVRASEHLVWKARSRLSSHDCEGAKTALKEAATHFSDSSPFHQTAGNIAHLCDRDENVARQEWKEALALAPAYARDLRELNEALRRSENVSNEGLSHDK